MLRLINTDFAASGKSQCRKLPPALFAHLRDFHVLRFEVLQGRGKVVAHEEKLVLVVTFGIVECCLKWWHGENQPAVAGIYAGKLQNIAKKGPISRYVLAVYDYMGTKDHEFCSLSFGSKSATISPISHNFGRHTPATIARVRYRAPQYAVDETATPMPPDFKLHHYPHLKHLRGPEVVQMQNAFQPALAIDNQQGCDLS